MGFSRDGVSTGWQLQRGESLKLELDTDRVVGLAVDKIFAIGNYEGDVINLVYLEESDEQD